MDVNDTLKERGRTYGDFADVAHRAQSIKGVIRCGKTWTRMASCQREAMEMMANKMARLLEGSPNHVDSWHDIAGYAQLVVQYLEGARRDE